MNDGFKVVEISADDYPNTANIRPLKTGDTLYVIPDKRDPVFSVGIFIQNTIIILWCIKLFMNPNIGGNFGKRKFPLVM